MRSVAEYRHIRLELARERGRPTGDPGLGYDIVAPLDAQGRIDATAWRADPSRCRVRRFRDGVTEAVGSLRHGPGGRWIFDFGDDDREDERGLGLEAERFEPGEYVSIRMTDGRDHVFRVITVLAVEAA